jgi:hypothetical protein
MAKEGKYLAFEVKKKGKGLFVDCAAVYWARSRKDTETILREHKVLQPIAVLTEREANKMLHLLKNLLDPMKFDKTHQKQSLNKLWELAMRAKSKAKNKKNKKPAE